MSTDDGSGHGEGMATASAPPEMDAPPPSYGAYPVLHQQQQSPHAPVQAQYQPMQPQQVVYGQPPPQQQYAPPQPQQQYAPQHAYANSQQLQEQKENQQLDAEISNKFDELIKAVNDRKSAILAQCQTANSEQKKDLLDSLRRVLEGVGEVKINPNIKPKVPSQPPPQVYPQHVQQGSSPNVIVMQQPMQQQVVQQKVVYISDTWNTQIAHPNLAFDTTQNTVYNRGTGDWLNAFGNQVIQKGQYKKWTVKILPRTQPKNAKEERACEVVVGVVDAKKVSNRQGGFWLGPMLGYGYYGFSGKKFHTKKRGTNYGRKYGANDTISVEINMQNFDLMFWAQAPNANQTVCQGKAFPVDARNSYVLAVALNSPDWTVKIC